MNYLISIVVVLGVLIFVHEFGHFLFAKIFGVRVLKFSLGFGSKVVGKKWGETEYLISAFPLGGYVKMFGENPDEGEIDLSDQHRSFSHKSVLQRFCIVAGGPIFNLVFALLLFWFMFFLAGLPVAVDTTEIGQIAAGSVAEKVGIKTGDRILSIDGQPMLSWEQISEFIKDSKGKQVTLVVQRDGNRVTVEATPAMDEVKNLFGEVVGKRYMLGISRMERIAYTDATIIESFKASLLHCWDMTYMTVLGIVKIIQRVIPASELGGPIRIAEIAGQQYNAGWVNFFSFMGLLSINLGILNLLPIPVLDGGHLFFLTIEGILRHPLSEKAMIISQKIGIALLASLMIFVFYNDIIRLVVKWTANH